MASRTFPHNAFLVMRRRDQSTALDAPVRRVMVGTDRSETAERAVQWAAAMAERYEAELHVVQVVIPQNPPGTEAGAAEPTRASFAAEDLGGYVRDLAGDRGVARVVMDTDPAMAIVRAAEDAAIDVLVVGNAGMAGRREFLLGNVPNRISHNARCTVIIVNTGSADGIRPRLVDHEAAETDGPTPVGRAAKIAAVLAKHGVRELFVRPDG